VFSGGIWSKGLAGLLTTCGQVRNLPIKESTERLFNLMLKSADKAEDDVVVLGIEV